MHSPVRIALAAVAALALTACSSGTGADTPSATPSASPSASTTPTPTPTPTPSATVPVSNSLDAITVTGEQPEAPEVEFEAPYGIDQTRVEVVEAGDGLKASEGGYVTVSYYGVNGRTGEVFDESYTGGVPVTFSLAGVIPGFSKGLAGQQVGSRVLIGIPGPDGYDELAAVGYGPEGYEVGDTLLFVVDIIDVSLTEPAGETVTPPAGLPTVSAGTGKPTITIPSGAAPTSMTAQVLIEGEGVELEEGDTILARYVGVSWKTGQVVDDGFDTPTEGALADLIPGWTKGLEGKTVGSRVLLVLPPADGFPEGSNNPPLEAGDTIVYVVDLLFAYAQ